jgi:hypothetical protein
VEGRVIAYKFLRDGGIAPYTGFDWPVDEWVDAAAGDPCRAGIHACSLEDLPIWIGPELWEIELDGEIVRHGHKLVALRGRLLRRVETWNEELIRDFGRDCVKRLRERVGFLPALSGYAFDADRLARQGRVPLAAFAAARAAELRDGPAAYDEERRLQALWLSHRLGLEGLGGRTDEVRSTPARLRLRTRLPRPGPRVPEDDRS